MRWPLYWAWPDGIVAVGDVALAVVIEEEGGIDAADAAKLDRFRPGPLGVLGGDIEIADAAHESAHDIEGAVVIADGRGVRAAGNRAAAHGELRGTVNDVADLRPVDQVLGMPDGNAGKVVEGGVDQIVIVADAADGGIGIEPGDDGVKVLVRRRARRGLSAVGERAELDPGGGVRARRRPR